MEKVSLGENKMSNPHDDFARKTKYSITIMYTVVEFIEMGFMLYHRILFNLK